MRKILLIEDRFKRQQDLLDGQGVSLDKYNDILDNKIGDEYLSFNQEIKDDNFNLNSYEVIIAHESIFKEDNRVILNKLRNYCKAKNKPLVLFSGNNEDSYLNEGYEELGLISTKLYSENLVLFLDDFRKENCNILILSYGRHWKTNVMLNVLERISYFISVNSDNDIDYDDFKNTTKSYLLDSLEVEFYKVIRDGSWIDLSEIIKYKEDIITHIKEMIDD